MHLDGIAVGRRHAEIDDLLAVLGIVAEEPVAELRDEAGAEEPRQLAGPEHAVQRIGADERHAPATHARRIQLVEDGADRDLANAPERSRGVIVEGDGHRRGAG